LSTERCRNLVSHYDADKDGMLSYKEFLEIVLPKEHPDLRAHVTQRDCYNINEEEYLSYETEAAMAILFEREVAIFAETMSQKEELDNLALSGHKIVELIDGSETGSLNFNNVQKFLHSTGLMPYDSEIIAFLRRVDRDDDGVITGEELNNFIQLFHQSDNVLDTLRRKHNSHITSQGRLKTFSPGRQIVTNKLIMLSPQTQKTRIL
jgi:Ca2+-binding EF-hand superfamily protein